MDDQRVVLGPVLGLKDALRSDRVERIRGQAIDCFGRHANYLAVTKDLSSLVEDMAGMWQRDFRHRVFQVCGGVCDCCWVDGLQNSLER